MSRLSHRPARPRPDTARSLSQRLALIATALVTALAVILAVPSAAEAKKVYKKAPSISVSHPMVGESFTLKGGLGKSVKRYAVLQRKVGGRWVKVQRTLIKAGGRYAFKVVQPSYQVSWRVRALKVKKGGRTYPTRISAVRTITRAGQSGRTTATGALKVGGKVSVTAAFSPARKGRAVQIQIRLGQDWVTLASGAQSANGRFSTSWKPTTNGTPQFRAITLSRAGAAPLTTAAVTTNVLPVRPVQISAHRGFSATSAENSWHAFNGALKQRAEWIETDFRLSAPNPVDVPAEDQPAVPGDPSDPSDPGQPAVPGDPVCAGPAGTRHWVIMHDPTFARTTDVATVFPGRQGNDTTTFTCQEIKRLKVDSLTSPGLAEFGVLTLPEFVTYLGQLEVSNAYSGVRIMVEYKGSKATEFADLYDRVKALAPSWIDPDSHDDKAVFTSFGYASAFAPLVDPSWDGDGSGTSRSADGAELAAILDSTNDQIPDQPTATNANWLQAQIKYSLLSLDSVAAARKKVAQVVTWTPATSATIQRSGALGVDIVTTGKITVAKTALLR